MGESELVVMQTTNIENPVQEDGAMVTSDATLDSTSLITTGEVHNMADGPVNSHLSSTVNVANASEKTSDFGNVMEASNQIASSESVASINGVAESQNFSVSGNHENGVASIEIQEAMTERRFEGSSELSVEEDRLWNIVRANSLDFNAWTALIQETEKVSEENILKIRKIYDAFLAEFPLCYGYWKKYADHEARLGGIDKIVEVYERAVQSVTYSVDIWLHYCVFAISTFGDSDSIRRLFERGLAYVGSDYLSYPLWDKYIEYEYSHQVWSHLAMIYTRILENPIQQLDRYFNSFKELAASRPLSELRTPEEEAMLTPHSESSNHGVNNESHAESLDQSPKPMRSGLTEAEEFEKYVAIREEMYKKAKEFDSKILDFETAITRPYFHVKPLDEQQLENWHAYLDFIEGGDDFNKIGFGQCLGWP